jgi:hypothetical protein
MKRVMMVMLIGFGLVLTGPMNPLTGSSADAAHEGDAAGERLIKDFTARFLSLPLRGFFYPPAVETTNIGRYRVWENGDGVRHTRGDYTFRGLTPNATHTLWHVNLFMMTRQSAFPGVAPPSPQGSPYTGWNSGVAGIGYDANGDGVLECWEGARDFDKVITVLAPSPEDMDGDAVGTGQAPEFDKNSFCANEYGHSNPVITWPYDITTKNIPAQTPPQFQTEVVTDFMDGVPRKQRHVVGMGYKRIYDENTSSPRYGFQKVDNNGRPIFRTWRMIPMVVCTHFEGGVGMSHGQHPGNGPDDGPTPTALGSDHECLMANMPTTQARNNDAD